MTEDTITKLGKFITASEGRDAVHIAVAPVVSASDFYLPPGHPIGFVEGSTEKVVSNLQTPIGIVDPFLPDYVVKNRRFWMFLRPATITSLRHVWTHPAFPEEITKTGINKAYAEAWLRSFIASHGEVSYEAVLDMILRGPEGDLNALCFGEQISGSIPNEFWDKVEIVTGQPMKWRPTHFRCAC